MADKPKENTEIEASVPKSGEKKNVLSILLSRELTPLQFKWAVRAAIVALLGIGVGQQVYEYKKNAKMMKMIEGRGGKKVDLVGQMICNGNDAKVLAAIPESRRGEKPIEVEMCNREFSILPYHYDLLKRANDKMVAETGECIQVNYACRTNMEQYDLYLESISKGVKDFITEYLKITDPNVIPEERRVMLDGLLASRGSINELTDEQKNTLEEMQLEMINKGKIPEKSYVVAGPCESFHEMCGALDIINWYKASPYLHAQGFQGGIDRSSKLNPKFGLNNDLCHFSIGEFKMMGLAQKMFQEAKDAKKRLFQRKGTRGK